MAPLETKNKTNLAKKILLVMAEIGTLNKDKKNEFHNYQYASDELIVTAVRAALIKHNLSITTSQKSCTEIMQKTAKGEDQILTKLEMEFELTCADSGESKVVTFFGYGTDRADKGVYKAMTGAEKYFLMKTFLIATPDDPEFEKTQRDARAAAARPAAPFKPVPRPAAPVTTPVPISLAAPAWPHPGEPAAIAADFPPPAGKAARRVLTATLKGVTKLTKTAANGASMFRLQGTEGESWLTFSETVAKNASEFAKTGKPLLIALDMNPGGPVVAGVKPA